MLQITAAEHVCVSLGLSSRFHVLTKDGAHIPKIKDARVRDNKKTCTRVQQPQKCTKHTHAHVSFLSQGPITLTTDAQFAMRPRCRSSHATGGSASLRSIYPFVYPPIETTRHVNRSISASPRIGSTVHARSRWPPISVIICCLTESH